jgi:hypothetical protein
MWRLGYNSFPQVNAKGPADRCNNLLTISRSPSLEGRQILVSLPAQLDPRRPGNRRHADRRSLRLGSVLAGSGTEVIIHDLSMTGFLIETSGKLTSGETLLVELPEQGPTPATVVWNRGRFFGCEFEERVPDSAISAALLRNPIFLPQGPSEFENDPFAGQIAGDADDLIEDDEYLLPTTIILIFGLFAALGILIGLVVIWLL